MFTIILYIGDKFLVIGVILAIWAATTQIVVPLCKGIFFVANSPKLKTNRPRAYLVTIGVITALGLFLFGLPFPHRSLINKMTWPSESSQIRASSDDFVADLPVTSGSTVLTGQNILVSKDPFLTAREDLLQAQINALEIEQSALAQRDRVQAQLMKEKIIAARGALDRVRQQIAGLTITAPQNGTLVVLDEQDLNERYLRKGTLVGFILDDKNAQTLRIVVGQDAVGNVRNKLRGVEVISAGWQVDPISAAMLREVPSGTERLPTPALNTLGGGDVPVDPRDPQGVQTLERVFEFELQLPTAAAESFLGRRATVKLDYGYQPLGIQLWTSLRQLFLRLYNV